MEEGGPGSSLLQVHHRYLPVVLIILQYGLQDVGMVIIGNKCDLDHKRVVKKKYGEEVYKN